MEATAYIGTSFSIQGNALHITVPPGTDPRVLVSRIKFWGRDCLMVLKSTESSIVTRPTTQQLSTPPPLSVSGKLSRIEVAEGGTITATLSFDPEQFYLVHDICYNLRPDRAF